MQIRDERINSLIDKFFEALLDNALYATREHLEYPGGIVWVTEKQASPFVGDAAAYIKKVMAHGNTPGSIDFPLFKIILIKERVLELTDDDFLFLLAHECGRIFFSVKNHPDEEIVCGVLAEHLFGFAKPKASVLG